MDEEAVDDDAGGKFSKVWGVWGGVGMQVASKFEKYKLITEGIFSPLFVSMFL
jgi:hypothetical protein